MQLKMKVKGMTCSACEQLVQEALTDEGAKNVKANHTSGTVSLEITDNLDKSKVLQIIKEEGYEVVE